MTSEVEIPVEERILQVLRHLGIEKAHFAGLNAGDWGGLAVNYPDCIASLTLVCPQGMTSEMLAPVASRLLVFSGDQGPMARAVQRSVESLSSARVVIFKDYETLLYTDVIAERRDEVGSTMLKFLDEISGADSEVSSLELDEAGEVAGITYRIEGDGPPLVLCPLGLALSQWQPLLPSLCEKYCVIRLGGAHLGSIRDLETRARTGFRPMVRNLMEDLLIKDGDAVLDVGCGSGAFVRELAELTGGRNSITAVDYSPYMVAEAMAIARARGLGKDIEFQEGNAQSLPFPDSSFDVAFSVTVMEEVDADLMLAEMVRVTMSGGRVGIIVRANDSPWVVNLPVSDAIRRKVEPPGTMGGGMVEGGCADRSLYDRFVQAGLDHLKISAQLATFSTGAVVMRYEAQVLGALTREEAEEWRVATARAKADGTFFIAMPFHCAVGTKPG